MFCMFRETRRFCCCVTNGIKIDTIVMTKWWNFGIYRFVIVVISGFVYCILHVCGGDPILLFMSIGTTKYSPRMWRWSQLLLNVLLIGLVFSTYVEVILKGISSIFFQLGILHVCGGDPNLYRAYLKSKRYSPRMWRWSLNTLIELIGLVVFSTYVEVILLGVITVPSLSSILHVCGGDPKNLSALLQNQRYSPRMWRWS